MSASLMGQIKNLASVDLFAKDTSTGKFKTGLFIGNPFYLDYERAQVLVNDAWKLKAKGIPQGSFLLAYYDNEESVHETLLLRVLQPAKLPTDNDIVRSMIEYYKDNNGNTESNQLDSFTRYEFSFSGVECRVLGTFYKNKKNQLFFGADVENFYSANNYSVYKPHPNILELIANFKEGATVGKPSDIKVGKVRYSSSRRFQQEEVAVPVYVSADDFLGKRTALFGMTRTGKSNTVKKIIQATAEMSNQAPLRLTQEKGKENLNSLESLTENGMPKFPVGQIIFDINGEYANANMQDEGTAIFELYSEHVTRYSVMDKPGFKVLKVNFYSDVISGFELIKSHLSLDNADYVKSFLSIDLAEPDKSDDDDAYRSAKTRYDRKVAAYLCCLFAAGFKSSPGSKVTFSGNKDLNLLVKEDGTFDPKKGLSLEEATNWFNTIWDNYDKDKFFDDYKKKKGREWADEDLKALLIMLSKKSKPGNKANVSGFLKIRNVADLHTAKSGKPFEVDIIEELRKGKIVIIDLSQGNPEVQNLYSKRICRQVFANSMDRFISNKANNFLQFYFEEAHNLFPKKDDRDLSQIYNRIAKEGAKLNLGLIYATQEVSSISSNILKNTQNWFIAHLNNEDETKEIRKYYDFVDFSDSLIRFSASTDKGFVRMKTYSNPFVVPVQIDRFTVEEA